MIKDKEALEVLALGLMKERVAPIPIPFLPPKYTQQGTEIVYVMRPEIVVHPTVQDLTNTDWAFATYRIKAVNFTGTLILQRYGQHSPEGW